MSLKEAPHAPLHPGDKSRLMLYQENEGQRYQEFDARIVRFESDKAALEFTESVIESHDVLDNLIQKELHFIDGSQKLINLGREAAEMRGIGLTDLHFDSGKLLPEREIHTLRLSVGEHSIKVHLHRQEIEAYNAQIDSGEARAKVYHAIDRLNACL